MITSAQNPLIKACIQLRKHSARAETGRLLIEGFREISFALNNRYPIDTLITCPELMSQKINESIDQIINKSLKQQNNKTNDQISVISANQFHQCSDLKQQEVEVTIDLFRRISYRENPDGYLAIAPVFSTKLADITLPDKPLVLVAESIEKPGNLGTLFRIADAAGAHAVISSDPCTDLGNPNLIRASQGTVFSLQKAESTNDDTLAWLHSHNLQIIATSAHAEKIYTEPDYSKPTALVFGTESTGLTDFWKQNADHLVKIPMAGQASSLNIASAASVLVFEAVKKAKSISAFESKLS
ncbi:MAG TPA: RNA methyltransferase [bacterium]|nr:RNA methyltransferase [bacterium]